MSQLVKAAALAALITAVGAQAKPPLPQDDYVVISQALVILLKCSAKGLMSPQSAATGVRILNDELLGYEYDRERLNRTVLQVRESLGTPSAVECADIANIGDQQVSAPAPPPPPTPPRPQQPPQENAWTQYLREQSASADRQAATDESRRAREQQEYEAQRQRTRDINSQLMGGFQTPSPTQPRAQSPTADEGYQLVMVNTPNGLVQKRCKVLNGKAVACF